MKRLAILGLLATLVLSAGCSKTESNKEAKGTDVEVSESVEVDEAGDEEEEFTYAQSEELTSDERYEYFKSTYEDVKKIFVDAGFTLEPHKDERNTKYVNEEIGVDYFDIMKRKPGDYMEASYYMSFREGGEVSFVPLVIRLTVDKDDISKNGFKFDDTLFSKARKVLIPYEKEIKDLEKKITNFYKGDVKGSSKIIEQNLKKGWGREEFRLDEDYIEYTISMS